VVDQTLQLVVLLLTKARRHAILAARIADLDLRARAERPDILGGEPREDLPSVSSRSSLPNAAGVANSTRVVSRQHGGYVGIRQSDAPTAGGSRRGRLRNHLIAFTAAHQSQYRLHALRRF
jgi:hypothetical protein